MLIFIYTYMRVFAKWLFCKLLVQLTYMSVLFTFSNVSENIMFSTEELTEIKRVSSTHLRLLGFKPLTCLKDYHNLKPSTFIFPSDEVILNFFWVFFLSEKFTLCPLFLLFLMLCIPMSSIHKFYQSCSFERSSFFSQCCKRGYEICLSWPVELILFC